MTLSKSLQPDHFSLLRRELEKFTTEIKLYTESLLRECSGHLDIYLVLPCACCFYFVLLSGIYLFFTSW